MSEANYPEVQLQEKIWEHIWWAETFTPRETHEVEYVSVKLWAPLYIEGVIASIQYAPGGVPTGVDLCEARIHWPSLAHYSPGEIVLFRFRPTFHLVATIEYALVIRTIPAWPLRWCWFKYEAPPGHYPRGKLIKSTNSGIDWDPTDRGDMLFAEWGDPPVPPSKPPPPLQNFAAVNITYTHWDLGLTICLATDVPCHLTCYYTDKEPLKHHTSAVIRGLAVPWHTYFCFVAWKEVEQNEYGCTLYHTFDIPNWQQSQTKWFTFRGAVDLARSPSIGPIFKHHHPGGYPRIEYLYPNAAGDLCQILIGVPHPCPDHWKNCFEHPPDEDASYVSSISGATTAYYRDLYNLETKPFGKIKSVTISARLRRPLGMAYTHLATVCAQVNGFFYQTPYLQLPFNYANFTRTDLVNPQTLAPWTQSDIDSLQAGCTIRCYWGVGWYAYGHCTQIFARVERGVEGCPDP